jgi:hypothetical protein
MDGGAGFWLERRWLALTLLFWLALCAWFLWERWAAIHWFALGDTDDNMRMMQVRAWLGGQDWYDLRNYRLSPPAGFDIHWSRVVDLPIAGLKLSLTPLLGGAVAERWAVAIAPLLPLALAAVALAATARRLIAPDAWLLALAMLACAGSARGMFMPLRIDHHGWQLACLAVAVFGLVDRRRLRGGLLLGGASALSLAIGLELLLYLAMAGALAVLLWVRDGAEGRRLFAYGASLAGGCALGYLLFASYDNRGPVCDALSPVWLSAMVGAGAAAVALAALRPATPLRRFGLAAISGVALAAFFALVWPECLGRLERTSPELEEMWLNRVREAMPVYDHPTETMLLIVSLPIAGLVGYAAMLWHRRRDPQMLARWAAVALLAAVAAALLLWQTRAATHAQMLAAPGAAGLAWLIIEWLRARANMAVRVIGIVAAFLVVSGLATHYAVRLFPAEKTERRADIDAANRRCPTLPALRPIAQQPRGIVLTFVDLGPRLITVTHHDALAGPYHRNGTQILDVMKAWRGDVANARATIDRYRADYVLICPNMSESTVYRSAAPRGFYAQLARGDVPDWLEPVTLPENSPYRMWRVRR